MNVNTIFNIFFIICLSCSFVWGISPVVLVPGDGGSQLEAKLNKNDSVHYLCVKSTSDYFTLWLNKELLVPLVIDCWVDNMKLYYDNVTRKSVNSPGVSIRVPGWGDPEMVEWLDPSHASAGAYFVNVANALVAMGYTRNISIRGAPYDFRKAPNENQEFFVNMKDLVEETYHMNNDSRVTLLTHSMGGTMTLHFLQNQPQKWKDTYIERLVTLAAPWGGAVKAVKVFAVGDNLGSFMLSESVLKKEQITSPSLSWLLPSPLFWKESEVLVETDKHNYTFNELENYFSDLNYPTGWEMRKDTVNYSLNFSPPGVELHCLYGTDVPTIERMVYKPGTWPEGYPTFVTGDGDGTVNIRSLEGCLHWSAQKRKRWGLKHQGFKAVYHLPLPKADHMTILNDLRVMDYLKRIFASRQ